MECTGKPPEQISFPALLKQHDHVIYTALIVINQRRALCWSQHKHRLQTSFHLYTGARSDAAGALSEGFIDSYVIPAIKSACGCARTDGKHHRVVVVIHSNENPLT